MRKFYSFHSSLLSLKFIIIDKGDVEEILCIFELQSYFTAIYRIFVRNICLKFEIFDSKTAVWCRYDIYFFKQNKFHLKEWKKKYFHSF